MLRQSKADKPHRPKHIIHHGHCKPTMFYILIDFDAVRGVRHAVGPNLWVLAVGYTLPTSKILLFSLLAMGVKQIFVYSGLGLQGMIELPCMEN